MAGVTWCCPVDEGEATRRPGGGGRAVKALSIRISASVASVSEFAPINARGGPTRPSSSPRPPDDHRLSRHLRAMMPTERCWARISGALQQASRAVATKFGLEFLGPGWRSKALPQPCLSTTASVTRAPALMCESDDPQSSRRLVVDDAVGKPAQGKAPKTVAPLGTQFGMLSQSQ